jgi:hypothetical protein
MDWRVVRAEHRTLQGGARPEGELSSDAAVTLCGTGITYDFGKDKVTAVFISRKFKF